MEDIACTKANVNSCMFAAWYNVFKRHTIRSEIIPLSAAEVDYLRADGVVMPEGCEAPEFAARPNSDNDDSDAEDWEHDGSFDTVKAPKLPELVEKIKRSIKALGGTVFPKLNWSAPQDATWMSFNGTLRCQSPYDVFLLLKASDFVTHDLTQPYKDCSDCNDIDERAESYELVLRRWRTVIPGMEFRCFVKKHTLVGVCQRDDSAFYEYLKEEHKKQTEDGNYSEFVAQQTEDIRAEIQHFFCQNIRGKFPLENYVVDVYRRGKDRFWIIDFNPFSLVTDALLFTWDELAEMQPEEADTNGASDECCASAASANADVMAFEFRINRQQGVQPSPYLSNRLPKDVVDLSTGQDINKFVDLFQTKHLGGSDSD